LAGAGGNTYLQESSGTLFLGAGGAGRVQVNASGNVGVGVTPSAWTISGAKAIQVGPFASLTSNNSGGQFTDVGHNIFGAYSYLTTAAASFYRQGGGQHAWHTAPSGTAGNAITFTQAMTLDASGNLGVGTASPNARLHVAGATPTLRIDQSSGVTATLDFANGSSSYAFVRAHSSTGELRYASGPSVAFGGFHAFYTDTVERWRMASAGHFLAGVDNTYDIGASGATRPRNVFVGTNVTVGTNTLVTDTANVRVGVGIAAPTQRLHVQAADTAAAPTILVNEAASSYEARLGVDSSGNGWVGTGNVANFVIKTNNTSRMVFNSGGGVILAGGALATSATSGFLYVRSCAGTPTGTPTTEGSAVPIVVDTTNHKLYFYSGGSWRDAGP
jgi:hypothetical protein